jgi:hypothetical protein
MNNDESKMIVKSIALLLFLFVAFGLFRIFSHNTETVQATMAVKLEVRAEDVDDFLAAISSVGRRVGFVQSKTVSKNPKGIDVVTLQLKKDDAIAIIVFNSLIDSIFSVYFYGAESDASAVFEKVEKELGDRWVLVRKK